MSEAIVRRISGVRTCCYVKSTDRHQYQNHLSDDKEEPPSKAAPKPGSDSAGSATKLQRPPGIDLNEFEVAAGQHDQGVVDPAQAAIIDEAILAGFDHVGSDVQAGPIGDDFSGDGGSCTQVPHLPSDWR